MINRYIKEPLFFQFNQFLDSREEIHQIFALFFGKFRTSKSHSEINRPLQHSNIKGRSLSDRYPYEIEF